MEDNTQINNNILRKIEESIIEDLDNKVLKYTNQYLNNEQDNDVLLCKIISLIKLEKYREALHLQNSNTVKKDAENYLDRKYLHTYTLYRVKEYSKALKTL
jgi:energy-converting hydrogenase A subunit M